MATRSERSNCPPRRCHDVSRRGNTHAQQDLQAGSSRFFSLRKLVIKGEWTRARFRDHLRVPITISIDTSTQTRYCSPKRTSNSHADVSAIADTGAQSDLACGFSRDNLLPVGLGLSAANRSPISIEGAFFAKLTTELHNGEMTSCRCIVYISSSVQATYVSHDSLLNLGILSKDFPSLQVANMPKEGWDTGDSDAPDVNRELPLFSAVWPLNDGCTATTEQHDITCASALSYTTTLLRAALSLHSRKQRTDESVAT